YLLFMRGVKVEEGIYKGEWAGRSYPIHDDQAAHFFQLWKDCPVDRIVECALKDQSLWGADLTSLNGFAGMVQNKLDTLMTKGAAAAIAGLADS
ncbi:MAG: altronate oxidoreductase, partial [Bacteroidota bacterium]|nr:altronate oxidoreductase [Bacteroidota bacterium]